MYLPSFLRVLSTRSLSIGTHPPQPVPAFVHFFIASTFSQLCSETTLQIVPLLTLSQLHISASSGKPVIPAPLSGSPPRAPRITSSVFAGSSTLFFDVCSNILYA